MLLLRNDRITAVEASPQLLRKLWIWAAAAKTEISALGETDIQGNTITISDTVHLLKQAGSAGFTELDMKSVALFIEQQTQQGKNTERIRFWFHTHPRMSAFFSRTDTDTITQLTDWMNVVVAAVYTEKGDSLWAVAQGHTYTEFRVTIPGPEPTQEEIESVKPLIQKFVEDTTPNGWKLWKKKEQHKKPWGFDPDREWANHFGKYYGR